MSDIYGKVTKALVRGIRDWLDLTFAESQRVVPVRTGFLKRSGYRKDYLDGGSFGYRADYAAKVEQGWPGGLVDVKAHQVRAHRRLTAEYQTRSSLYRLGMAPRPGRKWQRVQSYSVGAHQRYQPAFAGRRYMAKPIEKYRPQLGGIVGRPLRRLSA